MAKSVAGQLVEMLVNDGVSYQAKKTALMNPVKKLADSITAPGNRVKNRYCKKNFYAKKFIDRLEIFCHVFVTLGN